MPLRERIEYLLQLGDEELKGSHAAELEDVVQCGFAAVHSGELWIRHVARARETTPERAADLDSELARSRESVAEVRERVTALHARAQKLGVGAPG